MQDEMPFESEVVTRIGWLIRLRWMAILGTAGVAGGAALLLPGRVQIGPLLAVIAVITLYNVLLALYLRAMRLGRAGGERLQKATLLAAVQIVLDLLSLAVLLHFSGGLENPMVMFFVFHIIIACILLRRSVSFGMTGLAMALVSALAALEYSGLLPHHHVPVFSGELYHSPGYLTAWTLTIALTLVIVAFLTSSISARLREREEMLYQANASCQVRSVELASLNAELERVDAERTRFIVLVTHELRAPVATIHSALELVRGGYTTAEETGDMLSRAQRRASEMLALIQDLLDLSRIREGGKPGGAAQGAAPLQLAEVLREAVELAGPEVARNNLSLVVDVADELPEVRIPADQARLVWRNLLSNAIKYNQPGGSVKVSLRQMADRVVGEVSDTGIGIAAGDLPHIFEEFFRASNAKLASPHGSGVGMATVRRVIENWGGRITVESELNSGTTFRFELPRA